jgi:hypothetical protein
MSDKKTSELTNQLNSVASIVGNLGISIAEAQTRMDAAYVKSLTEVMAMTASLQGTTAAPAPSPEAVLTLIKAIGPSRYQFTETTLKVRLDLSKSLDVSGSLGLGASFGAVAVNAALTVGYAYDYQAAAECTTVIHAVPTDDKVMTALLDRAKAVGDKLPELPERSSVDAKLLEQLQSLNTALTTKKA